MTLPVWVTTASRVGLTGLVMDSTNAPVAGADIKLYPGSHRGKHARAWMRSHHQTHSDSTGEFYVPLVPGTYVLRATVPDGAGGRREIAVSQQELTVPSVGGVCIVVRVGRSANEPCP